MGRMGSERARVLPELISLTQDAIAEEIAAWLTEKLADDSRAYGVLGPLGGEQVLAFLRGGDVIMVDVRVGEVVPR